MGHPAPLRRTALLATAIFVLVFAVFSRCLQNDFVDWDDPGMLLENPQYRGLGPAHLRWMFTTFHMGHYQPLSWVTLALDYVTAKACVGNGLDPRPYHLTNVLLHAASAVLVYFLALRLLRSATKGGGVRPWSLDCAAVFAALLMALHPLRAESVAWVTERRDVLSSFLLLLTVLAYLRAAEFARRAHVRWLLLALLVYALSLLSRAIGVTLPLILLLLDWFPLKRIGRRALLEKLPFVILAVPAAIVAPLAARSAAATATFEHHGLLARSLQAAYGLVFYLRKTLLPVDLSPIYEMRLPIDVLAPRYLVSAALLLLAILGLILLRRRQPALVVALACYAILLAPVSGFGQVGNQETADRYSYLPSIALSVLAAAGLLRLWSTPRSPAWRNWTVGAGCGLVLVLLATLTWRQCGVWHDTATLWQYAAAVSPNSSIAQNSYGWVLLQQKRYDEALQRLRQAVQLNPANPKAHNNIWIALHEQGKADELLQAYRDSIRVYPTFADAYDHLGNELRRRGDSDAALANYRRAVELRPDYVNARVNLASLLAQRDETEEALRQYDAALRTDPRSGSARRGLAALLKRLGRTAEAIEQLRTAVQLDPNDATARQWLESWTAPATSPH